MKINKKLELAIKALTALKGKTVPTSTTQLATEVGTTVAFLEQIMRNLRMANLVVVKRGPGGGYELNTSVAPVTAYVVAQAVGRNFIVLDTGSAPTSRLNQSIANAFLNITI